MPLVAGRSWLLTSLCLLVAIGCGNRTPAPQAAARASVASTRGLAADYTPAQTCASMQGPPLTGGSASSVQSHLSGYRVCGPFTATAAVSSFDCGRPSSATGPFRLLAYNGRPDGTGRVSEATLALNGRALLEEDAFDNRIASAAARVDLAASNQITVRLGQGEDDDDEDRPRGRELTVEVVDEGQSCFALQPANVTRSSPLNRQFTLSNAFAVPEFQLFNGDGTEDSRAEKGQVSLNGTALVSRQDLREKVSAILKPVALSTTNAISASVKEGAFTVQIVDRDETPPRFSVDAPLDGTFTNKPTIAVSGRVDDPSAQVTVNGVPALVSGRAFTGQASLQECWNTLTVVAADACTNASQAQVRVGLDTVPPILAIASPAAGLVTNQPQQIIILRYSDNFSGIAPSSVRLSLDGADMTAQLSVGQDTATATLTLTEGPHGLRAEIADRAGNVSAADRSLIVDLTPPALAIVSPKDGSVVLDAAQQVAVSYSDALSGVALPTLRLKLDGADVTASFTIGPAGASASLRLAQGGHLLEASIVDLAGNAARVQASFTVGQPLPPDPATVAPPLDRSVATTLADASRFLYTGPNSVQTGVAPGTIQPTRVAVLRGTVHDRAGQPLSAVRISAVGRPEYGQTFTRADGAFDFVVNGGGLITLKYERSDLLRSQRQVTPEWQDYTTLPDVVLVPPDQLVSVIDVGSTNTQVARGSLSIDDIGSRRATVIFPPGTGAMLKMPDGSTQTVGTLHIRATELTVGPTGPAAMPAPLPPSSAYTYAAAFTADEALQAGAESVQFTQPVYGYLENYLAFPVGFVIPSGSYDAPGARWLPEANGKVVQVLSVTNGLANLDTNGDGIADDAATLGKLGITNAELAQLATLYQPGQSLWRVPMQHFSWDDWNVGLAIPRGSNAPDPLKPDTAKHVSCAKEKPGCTLEVENQVVREELPIVGTPYSLNYDSGRVPGRRANYRLNLTLPVPKQVDISGATTVCLPNRVPECQSVTAAAPTVRAESTVSVEVAGRKVSRSTGPTDAVGVTPAPWQFEWDGKDAYGREVQGEQTVTVRYCYNYPGIGYGTQEEVIASFGQPTLTGAMLVFRSTGPFSQVFDVCSSVKTTLGGWNVKPVALGGWMLSAQHMLDIPNKTVYRGDGGIQRVDDLNRYVVNFVVGTGRSGLDGQGRGTPISDGVPATSVDLTGPNALAIGPDGSIYFTDVARGIIGRVTPDGIFHIFAGKPLGNGSNADGVLASEANILRGAGLALAADGTLYYVDSSMARIRKVTPDGRIFTVAGSGAMGSSGFSPDGTPALSALLALDSRGQIAVAADGTLYFAEVANHRVRKIGPDGILRTVAGTGPVPDPTGFGGFSGDDGPASQAMLSRPQGVTLGPDGSLYIADSCNQRVRKVTPDGIIRTVAGAGGNCQLQDPFFGGNGGPATSAGLGFPFFSMAVAPDSTLFIADYRLAEIRRVTPLGVIDTVAGNGLLGGPGSGAPGCVGDGCPGPATALNTMPSVAVGPAGEVYAGMDNGMINIVRIAPASAKQSITVNDILVPSSDASEVYVFDSRGRHSRTLDALTNAQLQLFGYDSAGRIISVTDRDGNVTTVQRDAHGNPTAIVSPYGQQTTVAVGSDSYLQSFTNPNNELVQLSYKPAVAGDPHTGGLLTQLTDARNGQNLYEYEASGFLTKDTRPDGSFQTFDRGGLLAANGVTHRTALGRTETYGVSRPLTEDSETRTARDAAGLVTTTKLIPDQSSTVTYPDGTTVTSSPSPDPRFGIQAGVVSATWKTPAGLTRTENASRTVTLSNPNDPLRLTSLLDQVTVNGKAYRSTYDGVARTMTQITPAGRQAVATFDSQGRVSQVQLPGVLPVSIQYDVRGRPQTVIQGMRAHTFAYDALGRVQSVADPLHIVSIGYDGANRPNSGLLPDLSSVAATYDGNGNLLSLAPPGRTAHLFSYQGGGLEQDYTPPSVDANGTGHVRTIYDLDLSVTSIAPDGVPSIVPNYDAVNGRLLRLGFSVGTNSYTYVPASGRVASITAPDGNKLTYTYDGPLLLTTTMSAGPASGVVTRTYDADFRLATEAVTGGQSVTYGYDSDSLLTAAGALSMTRSATTGFVTGTTLGGVTESRTYDSFGAEQTYSEYFGATPLYSVDYGTRDALGRIVSKKETIAGEQHVYVYGYDARGRLTDVTKDGTPFSRYDYDANGNRLTGPGLTTSPVYDAQDRLLSYGSCTYSYRPDGSLQTKTCPDGVTTYDYDVFGNLRGVTLPGGTAISYVIDGQNRRVAKKVNGVLVESFLYRNPLQPVVWLDGSGAVKAQFVYGTRINVPEYMVVGTASYRFITDQVGSVRLVVNASTGVVAQRIDYDEFGNVVADSSPGLQPFGFAGGLRDIDTSLIRFGLRDEDTLTGRWTTKDLMGFEAGLNFYEYAGNDPVNRADPAGLYATFTHWHIIDYAFPDPSLDGWNGDRATWLRAQMWADYAPHQQGDEFSYRHAMSRPRGNSIDAYFDTQKYIRERKNCAIALEKAGRHEEAMFQLGLGMHAIMDSFSPQHRPYQPNPTGLDLLFHVVQELGVGVSSTDRAAAAAALREYHRSFRAGL